jgi:hypothetical protein
VGDQFHHFELLKLFLRGSPTPANNGLTFFKKPRIIENSSKIVQNMRGFSRGNTHEVSLLVRFLAFSATFAFIRKLPSFLTNKGARTQKGFADC